MCGLSTYQHANLTKNKPGWTAGEILVQRFFFLNLEAIFVLVSTITTDAIYERKTLINN